MAISKSSRTSLRIQLAPVVVALGYAIGRTIYLGEDWGAFHYPGPFTMTFLSGLLIAYACRPVMTRLPWSRDVGALLAIALLVGLGSSADRLGQVLMRWAGDVQTPLIVQPLGPELLGTLLAALLMGILYNSGQRTIDFTDLRARLRRFPASIWVKRLAGWSLYALLLDALLGWCDVHLWLGGGSAEAPLFSPNLWSLLSGGESAGAMIGIVLIWWLRNLLLILPLVPIAVALRGSLLQLLAVFSLLFFVIGDFAPLMTDQPYFSSIWLVARVAAGLVSSVLLGYAATLAIGQYRKPAE